MNHIIEAIKAGDKSQITAFEMLQSVCLSVIAGLPGLNTTETPKIFYGKDMK
jgi:hypothetical protein